MLGRSRATGPGGLGFDLRRATIDEVRREADQLCAYLRSPLGMARQRLVLSQLELYPFPEQIAAALSLPLWFWLALADAIAERELRSCQPTILHHDAFQAS